MRVWGEVGDGYSIRRVGKLMEGRGLGRWDEMGHWRC